jgi:hypothetical protein
LGGLALTLKEELLWDLAAREAVLPFADEKSSGKPPSGTLKLNLNTLSVRIAFAVALSSLNN